MFETGISLEPRKAPSQDRARATVEALLDATARILVEEGYASASTNRIARVAGVSIGSLYQYFPNRDALVLEVARRHAAETLTTLARVAMPAADAPVAQAVRTFVPAMVATHAEDPDLHRALVQQVLHLGMATAVEVTRQATTLVRAWLEAHRDEILPRDLDVAAFVLVTTVQGAVHAALVEDPDRIHDPAFSQELSDLVLRYLVGR